MKIGCECGNIIFDSSDFHSFKADIISDQDSEDFIKECVGGEGQAFDAMYKYSKTIYQCDKCARLILDLGDRLMFFKPEENDCPTNLLRSVDEELWKRNLRGRWDSGKGEVWWGFGVKDEGFIKTFASKEDVEKLYYEVFNRLKSQNILRDSFLDMDSEMVHRWPETKA